MVKLATPPIARPTRFGRARWNHEHLSRLSPRWTRLTLFNVTPKQYKAFLALMDAPLADNAALKRLLANRSPWEQRTPRPSGHRFRSPQTTTPQVSPADNDSLSQWLRRRALAHATSAATRTYVVCANDRRVVGHYALAAGSITLELAPARMRRNMPDPLRVIVLGRLAVHEDWLGRGTGSGLLKCTVLRALQACDIRSG